MKKLFVTTAFLISTFLFCTIFLSSVGAQTPPDNGINKRFYAQSGYGVVSTKYNVTSPSYVFGGGSDYPSADTVLSYIHLDNQNPTINRLLGFSPKHSLHISNQASRGGAPLSAGANKIWTVPENGDYNITFSATGNMKGSVNDRGNFWAKLDFYLLVNGEKIPLANPRTASSCYDGGSWLNDTQFYIRGSCSDSRGPYYNANVNFTLGLNRNFALRTGDTVELYGTVRGYAKQDSFWTTGAQDMWITVTASQAVLDVTKIEPAQPPTVTLSAGPFAAVMAGETTTLFWSSSNAVGCTATDGWSGSKSLSGTEVTRPLTGDTLYTITCVGPGGTASASTVVTVYRELAAPTGFTATPSDSCLNNWINLSWNPVEGATSYIIKEGTRVVYSGSGTSVSDTNLVPGSTHTYTIIATNPSGVSPSASTTGTVHIACPNPPTVDMVANPSSVVAGGSSVVSWSSTNASRCTSTSGKWPVATRLVNGSYETGPLYADASYTITCVDVNGQQPVEDTVTVTVVKQGDKPVVPTGFYAGPSNACANNWINLSWNAVNGATSYTVKEGTTVIYSGSNTSVSDTGLIPGSTHTYTLTAHNNAGSSGVATATATVAESCPGAVPYASLTSEQGTSVPYNSVVVLWWNTANVTACHADDGVGWWRGVIQTANDGPRGQSLGNVTETKTYSIYCTGPHGPASDEVTVAVTGSPDRCWNVSGIQMSVPDGMDRDSEGNCSYTPPPPTDMCANINGIQSSIPSGMYQGGNGGCYEHADVCNNISGAQYSVPEGLRSDGMGGCVVQTVTKSTWRER